MTKFRTIAFSIFELDADDKKRLWLSLIGNTRLEELDLSGGPPFTRNAYLYDIDIKSLAEALQKSNHSRLKELNLFKNRITNEGFIALLNLLVGNTRVAHTCTHLNLGGNDITGSTEYLVYKY